MAVPSFEIASRYQPRDGDCLVLAYEAPRKPCFQADLLPEPVGRLVRWHPDRGGSWTVYRGPIRRRPPDDGAPPRIAAVAVRLDSEHSDLLAEVRRSVASAVSAAKKERHRRIVVPLARAATRLAPAAQEGAVLGGYAFDRLLKKKAHPPDLLIVCPASDLRDLRQELSRRATVLEHVNIARDVLNEPPNVIRPPSLAEEFAKIGKKSGLRVSVWGPARLERERCGGILGVGQGSTDGPRLVIGEYAPRKARKHLCLVGKGITFDTGGYGLKPADSQVGMKYDMGGAAATFAAACAIARLEIPLRVTVLTPLAENVVSAEAYFTTSVLRTRSGRTVEVRHTDAEGRLVLADALTLACERKPDWVIDVATLTGACVVALGEDIAGAFGTDRDFTRRLVEAGAREGELLWELPLHMPYEEQIKATVADSKNVGSRWGGAIIGAVFLRAWVPDGLPWIHWDIAGPGCKEDALNHLGKGAKGYGVKTLVALARDLAG